MVGWATVGRRLSGAWIIEYCAIWWLTLLAGFDGYLGEDVLAEELAVLVWFKVFVAEFI